MASRREQVLSAVFACLQAIPLVTIRRNEALPMSVPADGLVILRDGDPGEPDVTLNPRTAYYSHRAEIEAFVTQPPGGGGEVTLDDLMGAIGTALAADTSLGGLAETLSCSAPEVSVMAIEGSANPGRAAHRQH
ncbi:MAG: acyl-CoA transferase [Defluviicoccus sp.]|nr:MAG: acyl-CoA transferase [Defluviicoccus sp.]